MGELDVRRVLIFRAVARAGSITGAARDLGWTQPAVSQHLSRLEREVGSPLVYRASSGVTLTEAGARLLGRADTIAAELRAAGQEADAIGTLESGNVGLVAFGSAAATIVPTALTSLRAAHPGITTHLDVAEPPEALKQVIAGDADLAVTFTYEDESDGAGGPAAFERWPLFTEPVRLVVSKQMRTGSGELSELAEADWVGGCERCRGHLVRSCQRAGFAPHIQHVTDDYVVVQTLVAAGLGVAVLPESALTAYRHPGVCAIACDDLGTRSVGVVGRTGAGQVPANAAMIRHFAQSAPRS